MQIRDISPGKNFVNAFLTNPDERSMQALLTYSRSNELTNIEILLLANGLANSGKRINLKDKFSTCDIPSTGGPASLSTLLCPLFLLEAGKKVLKLGVPGRPAGGIDVLAQIQGYNIAPSEHQLHSWIESSGYVHFIANRNFAPMDALLFRFRKENNGISIPSLAIASLLSKKIAVGLDLVGLDIRISDFGNFGKTWEDATQNAHRFNQVAALAGITSKCFLSDGNIPQQPYTGRGEAILALNRIFTGYAGPWLENHVSLCFKMSSSLSERKILSFSKASISHRFFANVLLQGGTRMPFEEIAFNTEKDQIYYIKAPQSGFLKIDLLLIRDAICKIQKKCSEEFPDPCGLILKVNVDEYVKKDDIICTFRCIDDCYTEFVKSLKTSFRFMNEPVFCREFEEIE